MIAMLSDLYGRFMCAILLPKDVWIKYDPGFKRFVREDTSPRTLLHLLYLDTVLGKLVCRCVRCGREIS